MLRKRLSYANVTASLALFMTLGGVGYAASQLPNNSVGTPQLKANAVTSSKVKNGTLLRKDFKAGQIPAGPKGATGATGPAGAAGATGPAGPFVDTLPSGKSLKGAYSASGTAAAASAYTTDAISFEIPLAVAPTAHFVGVGTVAPSQCPGTVAAPTAAAGNLCIYEGQKTNIVVDSFQDPVTGSTGSVVRPWGAEVVARSTAAGDFVTAGSWAVTAQ
jgi:hypothetical protein